MSTWCALHINSENSQEVIAEASRWLASTNDSQVESHQAETVDEIYGDKFLISEQVPSMVGIGSWSRGWTSLHFNSFNRMSDFASAISEHLKADVLTVMMQSVSEAYFIEVFRNGEHLRTLSYSGDQGQWDEQEGDPLPFEKNPLGHNISEKGEDPFFVFGREDTEEYCKNLGLDLRAEYGMSVWQILEVRSSSASHQSSIAQNHEAKPWWKFW